MKRNSIADMKTLLEYSSDALLISDSKGKILYVTPSIKNISGITVETHLNRNIRDLLDDRLISQSATLGALEKEKSVTCRVRTVAGIDQVNTALPVIDPSGKLDRVVCNIRNLKFYQQQGLAAADMKTAAEAAAKDLQGTVSWAEERSYPYKLIGSGEHEIVVKSREMGAVVEMTRQVGKVDSTIIIYGETGVGKELVARLAHSCSSRSEKGSFIKVNCASFTQSLLESELFGYEPGSFTGALKSGKAGYFELANGGTLFLDEIAELSLEAQAKLLGVLQDKELFRVGGARPKTIDIRIIAATNKNLQQMVREGCFREDLFYRLNVVPIEVPPLRERRDDIPALVLHFSRKLQKQYMMKKELSPDLVKHFIQYPWPGNVRELYNLIERLFVTVPQRIITTAHLAGPYRFGHLKEAANQFAVKESSNFGNLKAIVEQFTAKENESSLKEIVSEFEMALVKKTVESCDTQEEAAKILGISLSSLTRRLRKMSGERG
ncbi:MAG TPA: sigma 54-interacting transcriptional regulator [Firmicutes bacterium]|nr:sigma 54-interacting transcriptional regulator [Bacillota bacterium]